MTKGKLIHLKRWKISKQCSPLLLLHHVDTCSHIFSLVAGLFYILYSISTTCSVVYQFYRAYLAYETDLALSGLRYCQAHIFCSSFHCWLVCGTWHMVQVHIILNCLLVLPGPWDKSRSLVLSGLWYCQAHIFCSLSVTTDVWYMHRPIYSAVFHCLAYIIGQTPIIPCRCSMWMQASCSVALIIARATLSVVSIEP